MNFGFQRMLDQVALTGFVGGETVPSLSAGLRPWRSE